MAVKRYWYDFIPPVAENRVAYLVFLVFLTMGLLVFLSTSPPGAPPPGSLFLADDTAGGGVSGQGRHGVHDLLDSGKGGLQRDGVIGGPDPAGNLSAGTTADSAGYGGRGEQASPVEARSFDELTFDELARRSGLAEGDGNGRNDKGDAGGMSTTAPGTKNAVSLEEHGPVPTSLAELLKYIGELQDGNRVRELVAVARDKTLAIDARTLAVGALRRFRRNERALQCITDMVLDADEAFSLREAALSSLVYMDGKAFDEFFTGTCREQFGRRMQDGTLCELLILAAYDDCVLYGGRSLKRLIPVIEQMKGTNTFADELASFKLRLDGTRPGAEELVRMRESRDPVVLSNVLHYYARMAGQDEGARKALIAMARKHPSATVRRLAGSALARLNG